MLGCSAKIACKIPAVITVDGKNKDDSLALQEKVEARGWGEHVLHSLGIAWQVAL